MSNWKEYTYRVESVSFVKVVARDLSHSNDIFAEADLSDLIPHKMEWEMVDEDSLRDTCRCCLDSIERAEEENGFVWWSKEGN